MAPYTIGALLEADMLDDSSDISLLFDFSSFEDKESFNLQYSSVENNEQHTESSIQGEDKFLDNIMKGLFNAFSQNPSKPYVEDSSVCNPTTNFTNTMSVLGVELNLNNNASDNLETLLNSDIYNIFDETVDFDLTQCSEANNFLRDNYIPLGNFESRFPHMNDEKNRRRRNLLYESTCRINKQKDHIASASYTNKRTLLSHRENEKLFLCPIDNCEKVYAKPSHLKAHLKRHTGEKPFVCNWKNCTWKFSRSDELARHKRSHSGFKPYQCELCEKAFTRSDHLSKHTKVHRKRMAQAGTVLKNGRRARKTNH